MDLTRPHCQRSTSVSLCASLPCSARHSLHLMSVCLPGSRLTGREDMPIVAPYLFWPPVVDGTGTGVAAVGGRLLLRVLSHAVQRTGLPALPPIRCSFLRRRRRRRLPGGGGARLLSCYSTTSEPASMLTVCQVPGPLISQGRVLNVPILITSTRVRLPPAAAASGTPPQVLCGTTSVAARLC